MPSVSPNLAYTRDLGVTRVLRRRSRAGVRPFRYSCSLHMSPPQPLHAVHRPNPPYLLAGVKVRSSTFADVMAGTFPTPKLLIQDEGQTSSHQHCEVKSNGLCVGRRVCENLRPPGVRILVYFAQWWWFSTATQSVSTPKRETTGARLLCLGRDWKARIIADAPARAERRN
jgi:hypothetical protein